MSAFHAHQDHITVLQSSHDQLEMYSGSKDGIVQVWNLASTDENDICAYTLNKTAQLQGQGSAITAIAALEPQSFGKMFVYGSQDKSLRICKNSEGQGVRPQDFIDLDEDQDYCIEMRTKSMHTKPDLQLNIDLIEK